MTAGNECHTLHLCAVCTERDWLVTRIDSSVRLRFEDLWILGDFVGDDSEAEPLRKPLYELTEPLAHIHGLLVIEINGRRLPGLEFFPDDVCMGEWAFQLRSALKALRVVAGSKFVFDEGEQGQPAFVFEREGALLLVSVAASELGGGRAESEWQRIACPFVDFEAGVEAFLAGFRARLVQEAPAVGELWWKANVARDP